MAGFEVSTNGRFCRVHRGTSAPDPTHAGPSQTIRTDVLVGWFYYMLRVLQAEIAPRSQWRERERVFALFDAFRRIPLATMGMPINWRDHALWRLGCLASWIYWRNDVSRFSGFRSLAAFLVAGVAAFLFIDLALGDADQSRQQIGEARVLLVILARHWLSVCRLERRGARRERIST